MLQVYQVLPLICTILIWSCSSGFQSDGAALTSNITGDSQNSGLGNGTGSVNTKQIWEKAIEEINGQVSGGAYDSKIAVEVLPEKQSIALVLPLPPIFLAPLTQIQVSQLPGITVEYRRTSEGGYDIAVIIPIQYIIRGAAIGIYDRLPNGDPIPFMPSGESRGFAIEFPQKQNYRLHFYFVANAVGVFIETPDWRLPDELSLIPNIGFPIKNRNQTQINGYFAIIPNKGNFSSGLFVSSRIPRELAFQLDQILRY